MGKTNTLARVEDLSSKMVSFQRNLQCSNESAGQLFPILRVGVGWRS